MLKTMKEPGFVYILTNPSFKEDWVKIGKSSVSVEKRVKQLDGTSVPLPFEIFATMKTVKYNEAEKLIHRYIERFTNLRIRDNREFFNVKPEDALAIFRDVAMVLDDAEIDEVYKKSVTDDVETHSGGQRIMHTPSRSKKIVWMVPANSKFFDLAGCLEKYGYVYWSQYYHFQTGDTVYIYCSSPESRIRYKMIVEAHDLNYSSEMEQEREFYVDPKDFDMPVSHNRFAKMKLVSESSSERLSLVHLMDHGLGMAPRGAMCLNGELLEYVSTLF